MDILRIQNENDDFLPDRVTLTLSYYCEIDNRGSVNHTFFGKRSNDVKCSLKKGVLEWVLFVVLFTLFSSL